MSLHLTTAYTSQITTIFLKVQSNLMNATPAIATEADVQLAIYFDLTSKDILGTYRS